jgi:hypothetical protein
LAIGYLFRYLPAYTRRYFLSISKNGKIVVLAFSSPAPLSQAALEAVYQEYDDVAQPGYTENYQITLQVSSLPLLQQRHIIFHYIQKFSIGWPC